MLRNVAVLFGFWLALQPAAAQDWNKIMAEAAWDWRPGDLVFLNDVNAFDDLVCSDLRGGGRQMGLGRGDAAVQR